MDVKNIWLSWLDDPKNSSARKVKNSQKGLIDNLSNISKAQVFSSGIELSMEVDDVLGFYQAEKNR